MSSRSSLVHHLHFEFSEHCDFNTNSPQLGGITLLLCLLSLLVDQSSPNPQEGWHTTRTKRIRNSALDFNTIFGWCKPQKRFQLSKWLLMLNHLSFLLTTEPKLILESGPSDVGKGCRKRMLERQYLFEWLKLGWWLQRDWVRSCGALRILKLHGVWSRFGLLYFIIFLKFSDRLLISKIDLIF